MRKQEATIKIVNELGAIYGDLVNQAEIRQVVEGTLYNYTVEDKPTSLVVVDNMKDMTFMYLTTRKTEGLADSTLKSYNRAIERFSRFINKNAEDVTAMDIRHYIASRTSEGLKNSTLANDANILRGFFGFLEDEEYIDKNPMNKVKTVKVEKRLRKALTKEQFEKLRIGAKTLRQKALLELMYSTGCRLEETENIKREDIDWQKLQIKVVGKGNKERVVYINATAQVHIREYLMSRSDDCNALFVTQRKPIKFLGKRGIQKEIKK